MPGLREGTAGEAGLSAQRLDHVRDLAKGWVKEGIHSAVVVLVARHGVIALHDAFGSLGPERDDPPLPRDALFPLASLVKPITATALMMLVEEGRVGLTRPVYEYLPEFAGRDKEGVYVHHLLTHTSGIEGPMPLSDEWVAAFTFQPGRPGRAASVPPVIDELFRLACERSLRKPPGEEMFYDTFNYELLGEIIRRVSGRSLPEFYRERIFDPLGMSDSYLTVPADARANRIPQVRPEGPWATFWEIPLATFLLRVAAVVLLHAIWRCSVRRSSTAAAARRRRCSHRPQCRR